MTATEKRIAGSRLTTVHRRPRMRFETESLASITRARFPEDANAMHCHDHENLDGWD
jgi:hypothetical protein